MVSYVIDDEDLRRLSPSARGEVLRLLRGDLDALRRIYAAEDWTPDRDVSYPLSDEEAQLLARGVTHAAREALHVFAQHYDGEVGRASIDQLLKATGHERYEDIGIEIASITQSVRTITGNTDAWLFNWRPEDWDWDEASQHYTAGSYFISGPAVRALRRAFEIDEPEPAAGPA